jgi:hypothetical protein
VWVEAHFDVCGSHLTIWESHCIVGPTGAHVNMCESRVGYRRASSQPKPHFARSDGRGFASDVARCGGGVWLGFSIYRDWVVPCPILLVLLCTITTRSHRWMLDRPNWYYLVLSYWYYLVLPDTITDSPLDLIRWVFHVNTLKFLIKIMMHFLPCPFVLHNFNLWFHLCMDKYKRQIIELNGIVLKVKTEQKRTSKGYPF